MSEDDFDLNLDGDINETGDVPVLFQPLSMLFDGTGITKSRIKEATGFFLQSYADGERPVLEDYIKLKAFGDLISEMQSELKKYAEQEVEGINKDERVMFGVQFETSNVADKYSYDHEPIWVEQNKKFLEEKEKLDKIQNDMKGLLKSKVKSSFIPEYKAVLHQAKVEKYGGTTIKVTIPK
jgi:hypothetical protein